MHYRQPGQTLGEYVIIGGSILLIAIMALTQFGDSLNSIWSSMVPAPSASVTVMANHPGTANAKKNTGESQSTAGSASSDSDAPLPVSGEAFPKDLQEYIRVAGANGTTKLYADQIHAMGERLLAAGEITEDQANLFYQLANQGNRIATIEKLVEDGLKSGNSTVTFEGKTYTPFELSRSIGWPDEPSSYYTMNINTASDALNRSPDSRSPEMNSFLQMYEKLNQSGAMSNAEVNSVVDNMSGKIAYLSEVIESNVADQHWGNTTTPLDTYMASQTSYWSSSEICGTGGGHTVGIRCK